MSQKIIHVGLDVDDVRYHGSALDRGTGEMLDFRCRPTLKGLVNQLEKVGAYFGGAPLKLCYEASYVVIRKILTHLDHYAPLAEPTPLPPSRAPPAAGLLD